jgi:hypothetical protein
MNIDLIDVGAVLFVFAPLAVLVGMFFLPDRGSLDDLILPPREVEWPRGVQEDEPGPWRFDHLTKRQRQASTTEPEVNGDAAPRRRPDLRSKRVA